MKTDIVILAAGQGSRMRSALPKVLHKVGAKTMVQHVIDSAKVLAEKASAATHVVIGHGAEQMREALAGQGLNFALQQQQLGTGHAVAQVADQLDSDGVTIILYGDVPLTRSETMQQMVEIASRGDLALLTVNLADPTGYGRIVRDASGAVTAIVEHKDASSEQRQIGEINTGILAMPSGALKGWLANLNNDNAQGEYYLTDVIAMAAADGVTISTLQPTAEQEVQGVNNKVQLAQLERWYQLQRAEQLMLAGATLADPSRVDVRGEVEIKGEVYIDVNAVFEGQVTLEAGVHIEANCVLKDAYVGAGTYIKANSMLEQSRIAEHCEIGPFARLRPGTTLAAKAKIGNFVETKKAQIGEGAKVNHLSYIGDATLGGKVNIGAGTITCNYDGVNKSQTVIGKGAFIGSNSSLVAPVTIGEMATVGAGSTVTKAVGDEQLAVARGKQVNLNNWARPVKKSADKE
ncbi:MAG: bifunctional UDP-N-acetylglucosamine diphosphorylase/glucosamine-1-phosphate N-acetyltransferase GlmU [Pseudomonadales bacterium]